MQPVTTNWDSFDRLIDDEARPRGRFLANYSHNFVVDPVAEVIWSMSGKELEQDHS